MAAVVDQRAQHRVAASSGARTAAELDDTLVLVSGLTTPHFDVARISAEVTGAERLRMLLGRTVRNPAAALASSLDCRQADVAAVLRARGDDDLADLTVE